MTNTAKGAVRPEDNGIEVSTVNSTPKARTSKLDTNPSPYFRKVSAIFAVNALRPLDEVLDMEVNDDER